MRSGICPGPAPCWYYLSLFLPTTKHRKLLEGSRQVIEEMMLRLHAADLTALARFLETCHMRQAIIHNFSVVRLRHVPATRSYQVIVGHKCFARRQQKRARLAEGTAKLLQQLDSEWDHVPGF